jgi:hypothetical protein
MNQSSICLKQNKRQQQKSNLYVSLFLSLAFLVGFFYTLLLGAHMLVNDNGGGGGSTTHKQKGSRW